MDPGSAIGLGLGAASLAVQLFDGAIKGFKTFSEAVAADRECEAFRLLLLLEYDRLQKWGVISGLKEARSTSIYDKQMKRNSALITAALSELYLNLKALRKTELAYKDFEESEPHKRAHALTSARDRSRGNAVAQDLSDTRENSRSTTDNVSHDDANGEPEEETLSTAEIEFYFDAIEARKFASEVRRRPRGLNHVFDGMAGLIKITNNPRRMVWAVKDSKKFKDKLARVTQLIDFLQESLRGDQIEEMLESMRSFRLLQLQMAQSVDDLKALLQAQQIALPTSVLESNALTLSGTTIVGTPHGAGEDDRSLNEASELRFLEFWKNATQFSIDMNSDQLPRDVSVFDATTIDYDLNSDGPSVETAYMQDGQAVWIEWKSYRALYGPHDRHQNTLRAPRDTADRIERLVSLLQADNKPAEFCVPKCLGYFEDTRQLEKRRFGLIYQSPSQDQSHWPPQTLMDYFGCQGISLSTRVEIAQRISRWLLYLHAVNWLHKGLRSASVLFFAPHKAIEPGQPYVTGFEFARKASANTTSTGPPEDTRWALYTHPEYLGVNRQFGFRKTYDMYSLGIILIEIAYWKPIIEILGFQDGSGTTRPTSLIPREEPRSHMLPERAPARIPESEIIRVREQLLSGHFGVLKHVKEVMGDRYHSATRACIEGKTGLGLSDDQDEYSPSIGALLQRAFIELVVDPLKTISV